MSERESSCIGGGLKTMKGNVELTGTTRYYAVDIEVQDGDQVYPLSVMVNVTKDENNGHTSYLSDVAEWYGLAPEDYPGNYINIEEFACAEAERLVTEMK